MKNILPLLLVFSCLITSQTFGQKVLYQSKAFTVFPDKVVQGPHTAQVISPTHLKSNYKSPASASFSRLVSFKFSINEKDNELPPGQDHWVVIGEEHASPTVVFGEKPLPVSARPATFLPVNYEYTFQVDMSAVLKQFAEKGYYEAYDGSRVAKADFKGFYIAGGSEPLSWDFVNLGNHGLKLQETKDPNIYSITLKFNPYNASDNKDKEWQLSADLSKRPQYHSEQPLVDALFNLSMEEATKNIEPDSTFRTGAKWGGVWTRDISYSILLTFAYHEPEVAKISLRKKVKRGRIIQDTGSGGAWPVSSDRTTWVLAAWEIYQATGDKKWLEEIYPIIKNTLDDDYKTVYSSLTGMYSGESSFLDWREQTYPKWMSNMDIYVSQNLGTNVVHFRAHQILVSMAKMLGQPYQVYQERAETIKKGINQQLWMEDRGYYAQYLYGRPNLSVSPRFEALGEALAVLFDVADTKQAKSIIARSPITDFGVPCIYPQIPGIPPYHNNAIWPFVQSYWNWAAAKTGNEEALTAGLASVYRASALFLTNYENMVAQTGDFQGTEINSDRMLWSMAGNMAMVYRVLMGMHFQPDGLFFWPTIPKNYGGKRTMTNFHYRQAVLDITVQGYGNHIKTFKLDGKLLKNPVVPNTITGKHTIVIEMDNRDFHQESVNQVANLFSLPAPQTRQEGALLRWDAIEGAKYYRVYKNGQFSEQTTATQFNIVVARSVEYKVSAVDDHGYESFTSEPVTVSDKSSVQIFDLENFVPPSPLPYTNFTGKGFVEIATDQNRTIACKITVPEAGAYRVDLRYSNGSGPWNTDNKCAIRSLTINGTYAGVMVLPQRGKDEWSDWGFSNSRLVQLKKGENTLTLSFEDWNNNMNVEVNRAMLDYWRVVRE